MNWFLFGAVAGTAATTDSGTGDRMLSALVYGVCFFLPLMPLVFAGADKKGYRAVTAQVWARLSMTGAAFFGYAGLLYVGITMHLVETTNLALLVALASLVWGLLVLQKAKQTYRPKYDPVELVSLITAENKHDFADTDFGPPVGREKL